MELRTKFRILSWAMILLVLLNVTVLTTAIITHKKNPKDFPIENNGNCNPMGFGNPEPNSGHFRDIMINELQLSEKQIAQIDNYRSDFLHNSHVYFDSLRIFSDEIDEELKKKFPDNEMIILKAEKIGEIHTKLKINFVNYYQEIHSILDENQQEKFHRVMLDFKKQKQMQHPGGGDFPPKQNKNKHKHKNNY